MLALASSRRAVMEINHVQLNYSLDLEKGNASGRTRQTTNKSWVVHIGRQ